MPFNIEEKCHLLRHPGIGPRVLERLEAAGFDSLARIQTIGVGKVVDSVSLVATSGWRNRRAALERALSEWCAAESQTAARS